MEPIISPLGDCALTVTFGSSINDATNNKVISLFKVLKDEKLPWLRDVIPAYASLSLVYDGIMITSDTKGSAYEFVREKVRELLGKLIIKNGDSAKAIEVPVCYDLSFATDLADMSKNKGISINDLIDLHTTKLYKVYMLGFLPGFAYMGKVDERLATGRKAIPATNIAAGSVGIAGEQTGIYPLNSPGGWNIIGRTPLTLFNADGVSPCLLQPGDMIKFKPVTLQEFDKIKREQ